MLPSVCSLLTLLIGAPYLFCGKKVTSTPYCPTYNQPAPFPTLSCAPDSALLVCHLSFSIAGIGSLDFLLSMEGDRTSEAFPP